MVRAIANEDGNVSKSSCPKRKAKQTPELSLSKLCRAEEQQRKLSRRNTRSGSLIGLRKRLNAPKKIQRWSGEKFIRGKGFCRP